MFADEDVSQVASSTDRAEFLHHGSKSVSLHNDLLTLVRAKKYDFTRFEPSVNTLNTLNILQKTQWSINLDFLHFIADFTLDGKKVDECIKEGLITKDRLEEIVLRTKKGGAEIVKYLEKGSAFYAPAASGVEMAESFLKDQKKQLPCAAYINGQYGVNEIYAGVPVIIGKNGVEKIIELELSKEEEGNFKKSIKAVQELFDAAKKIDPSL